MFDLASDRSCCKPSTTVVSQVSTVVNEVRRSEPWAAIPGGGRVPLNNWSGGRQRDCPPEFVVLSTLNSEEYSSTPT